MFKPITSLDENIVSTATKKGDYLNFLFNIIPDNPITAFSENNVMGVVFLALLLGVGVLTLPKEKKDTLHNVFSSFFAAILNVTKFVIFLMPIAIWAFITLFFKNINLHHQNLNQLFLYLVCILGANFVQGFIILPLFLKWKKLSPLKIAKGMSPALITAFFTKSSNATLPLTIKCAEQKLSLSPRVSNLTLPLCSVINMNACAAFILITVLFMSTSYGISFSFLDMILWVFLATLAAIGNAGVPMGCYFMATIFLSGMNVPLKFMGVILPFYMIMDMVETMLNVWSDACIATVVDKDLKALEKKELLCNKI